MVANLIEGLKKKPVLMIHFLISLFLSSLTAAIGTFIQRIFTFCLPCSTGSEILLLLTLNLTIVSIGYYVNFWVNLHERIKENIPTMLDTALSDYRNFIELLMDSTIYDFIRSTEKGVLFRNILLPVVSYYVAWINFIYSIDLTLLIITSIPYSIVAFLQRNMYLSLAILLLSLLLAQLIRPWTTDESQRVTQFKNGKPHDIQYLQAYLDNLISFKGIDPTGRYSKSTLRRIIVNYIENLLTLPTPALSRRIFVFDIVKVPYIKSRGPGNIDRNLPGETIERLLRGDRTEDYKLEPFLDVCKKLPKTNFFLLSKACWYKVYKRKSNEWKRIGYAMILIITRHIDDTYYSKEDLEDCIKRIRTKILRNRSICYDIIRKAVKIHEREETVIVILIGNEQLLGLKLLLM